MHKVSNFFTPLPIFADKYTHTHTHTHTHTYIYMVAQLVTNPPAMPETPIQFLGWDNPLEKG